MKNSAHVIVCAAFAIDLLLALEETLYYQACKARHAKTGDHYECLEENFECKIIFIHGFILARYEGELRHA